MAIVPIGKLQTFTTTAGTNVSYGGQHRPRSTLIRPVMAIVARRGRPRESERAPHEPHKPLREMRNNELPSIFKASVATSVR